MNAVNLLPSDLRRGSAAPSRSGVGVYVVLGALAVAVLLVGVTALLQNRVNDRESALAVAESEAVQAEAQAAAVARYKQLAADTSTRVESVRGVAAGRVEWADALTEISRTVGTKVAFTSLNASSSSTGGGGGGGNALRGAIDAPAIEINGCAENHPAVARLMTRLRAMNDVQRVSLASTQKDGDSAGSGSGSGSGDDEGGSSRCTATGPLKATFSLVIWLDKPAGATAATATAAAATAPATEGN